MKHLHVTALAVAAALVMGLAPRSEAAEGKGERHPGRPARFAVISDPHYYEASLGTEGAAFEAYLARDRKMIRESQAILESAIDGIIEQDVDFVIVSGDLTKDGELRSHLGFARHLRRLERHGIRVYVVPGNHDINNPEAFAYLGNATRRVPNVSPRLFKAIYHPFGYGDAIREAPDSLSYVVEPAPGLWLIGIDSCKYRDNAHLGHSETAGRISDDTLAWIEQVLKEARRLGKRVIAFTHHGILEHFYGQSSAFPEYVIEDWQARAAALAQAGLPVVFTGHYHAQDITGATFPGAGGSKKTIYDVETGSLVTSPCPYRTVSIDAGGRLQIATHHVTAIDYDTGNQLFADYARQYLYDGMLGIVTAQLRYGYGLDEGQAAYLAPWVTDGFVAHYAGNESPDDPTIGFYEYLMTPGNPPTFQMLGQYLYALWTDLQPNDLTLNQQLWPAAHPARPGRGR